LVKDPTDIQVFLDRAEDYNSLTKAMDDVEASKGAFILVTGEAGIGKSALVKKVALTARKRNWTVMSGICLFGEGGEPYLPFIRAIKESDKGSHDSRGQDIPITSLPMGLMGVTDDEDPDPRPSLEFTVKRDRMFESVSEYLDKTSKRTPLLFFLDDLQWADSASIQLLYYLARSLKDHRVMLLGAYRSNEVEAASSKHPLIDLKRRLDREGLIKTLPLDRFRSSETVELVTVLAGAVVPKGLVDKIFEETEGNPYYIEEFIKTLKDKGDIIEGEGVKDGLDPSKIQIPSTVVGLINHRMKDLDDDQRKLIELCSVIGHEFRYDVLLKALQIDEDAMVELMDSLLTLRLIEEIDEDGPMMYKFKDKILREVVQNGMSRAKRRLMHKRVAESIEGLFEGRSDHMAYPLAYHYSQTNKMTKAFEHNAIAGEKALRAFAFDEAKTYLETALDLLTKLDEIKDLEAKEAGLLIKLGTVSSLLGDWKKGLEYYDEALKLSKDDTIEKAAIYRAIGDIEMTRAEWETAILAYDRSLRICEAIDDTLGMADSYRGLAVIYWRNGDHEKVMDYANKAMTEAKRIGNKHLIGRCLIVIGNSFNEGQEDYDKALEYYKEALEHFDLERDLDQVSRIYNNIGDANMKKEEWETAIDHFKKCLEISERSPIANIKAFGIANIGICYIRMGDYDKAPPYIDEGLKIFIMLDNKVMIPRLYQYKGRAASAKGNDDIAELLFLKAIEMQEDHNLLVHLADSYLQYGKLLKKLNRTEKARQFLNKALDLFEKIGSSNLVEATKKELGPS